MARTNRKFGFFLIFFILQSQNHSFVCEIVEIFVTYFLVDEFILPNLSEAHFLPKLHATPTNFFTDLNFNFGSKWPSLRLGVRNCLYWYSLEIILTHFANLAVQQQPIFAAQFWRTRAETWHQNTRDVTSWLLVATKNTPTWVTIAPVCNIGYE